MRAKILGKMTPIQSWIHRRSFGDAQPSIAESHQKTSLLIVAVLALLVVQSVVATAGDVTGPNAHTDRVEANTTDIYEITFEGNEIAQVGLVGDGDTDLDLYVYDENDNLIDSDLDVSDLGYVEWTPSWTGKFTIKIKNLGDVYNEYFMITN